MASYDEPDIATRNIFRAHGCTVTESPLTEDVTRVARVRGGHTIFGVSNVMHGGSRHGAPSVSAVVATGLGIMLASDYHYSALLTAPFKLAERDVVPLTEAWALVTANPAEAAGPTDRGALVLGLRVDAVVMDGRRPGLPRVATIVVGERLCHTADQSPLTG